MNVSIIELIYLIQIANETCRLQWKSNLMIRIIEFSLNVFTEFSQFSDKNICHYSKRAQTCHSATSYVRDQDLFWSFLKCVTF